MRMFQRRDGLHKHEQTRRPTTHHAARVCPFEEISPAANPEGVVTKLRAWYGTGTQPPSSNPARRRSIRVSRDASRPHESQTQSAPCATDFMPQFAQSRLATKPRHLKASSTPLSLTHTRTHTHIIIIRPCLALRYASMGHRPHPQPRKRAEPAQRRRDLTDAIWGQWSDQCLHYSPF